ncbi:unnamed protein product, partial [Polarella glacialis]
RRSSCMLVARPACPASQSRPARLSWRLLQRALQTRQGRVCAPRVTHDTMSVISEINFQGDTLAVTPAFDSDGFVVLVVVVVVVIVVVIVVVVILAVVVVAVVFVVMGHGFPHLASKNGEHFA